VGKQVDPSTVSWKIPIDPPGASGVRVIRLTNVRGNASLLPLPSDVVFPAIQMNAMVKVSGTPSVHLLSAPQIAVGQSVLGVPASVSSSASFPRCEPHNAVLHGGSGTAGFDFNVQVQEGFAYGFKSRTYLDGLMLPAPLAEQNVPGFTYATETGFFSPSLFTPAPTLGLADFGTRILVSFGSVSAGTRLFVPTTITLTGEYVEGSPQGQMLLVHADQNGKSAAGYEPIAPTAMIGTTSVAETGHSGSTAYATYEVLYSDRNVQETATIPVAVAFTNKPAIGTATVATSLAPLDTVGTANQTSHIPRFANFATPQTAYSIESCPAP
jgi:hypothetical protein